VRTLNLGVVAHVDAGKTTLTERLLFDAGVIDTFGSVDAGSTQTDSLELERRRGITIRSAVVSFEVRDTAINLIDTPGHPDFIAEVERALRVLDACVLVLSAVEGVQAQTVLLMRALRRLDVPTVLFVNKIDRAGADPSRVLTAVRRRLSPAIVPMGAVLAPGTRAARFVPFHRSDPTLWVGVADAGLEAGDETLVDLADRTAPGAAAWDALTQGVAAARVHPVLFGSAITGAGCAELAHQLTELLPAVEPDRHSPVSAAVFKIQDRPR
jgi:ribosomal protection tetracycline resistance protein